jgi:hypothetical protein
MNVRINKIIDGLKLPKTEREELNRLIQRPEVQAVINTDESEQIGLRKSLIKELSTLSGKDEKSHDSAAKALTLVERRWKQAQDEMIAANEALRVAQLASLYGDAKAKQRTQEIKRELTAGADPRIAEYRHEVGNITGRLSMMLKYWHGTSPKTWAGGGEPRHFSNVDDIAAARVELNKALVTLQELDFAAATNFEITQALKDISSNLKGPLAEIDMHPPIINEFLEVKPPYRDGTNPIEETKAA